MSDSVTGVVSRGETWPDLLLRKSLQAVSQQKSKGHQDWGPGGHRGEVGEAGTLAPSYVGLNLVAGGGGGGVKGSKLQREIRR